MTYSTTHTHLCTDLCSSINCYERYVHLAYEGPGSNIMSYTEWKKA